MVFPLINFLKNCIFHYSVIMEGEIRCRWLLQSHNSKQTDTNKGWIHLQHTCIAQNATTCLFASHLGYAYGVGDKSMARSSVRSYLIGYFGAVNFDYFSQRRKMPAQIPAKGLHFPVRLKCKYIFTECDKSIRHWVIAYPIRVSRMRCK